MRKMCPALYLTILLLLGTVVSSSKGNADPVAEVKEAITNAYYQYHFADLCHGSEVISDSEINTMQRQINQIIDFYLSGLSISGESIEDLKDGAWEHALEMLHADPTIMMLKIVGLGNPMTLDVVQWVEMREGCVYPLQAINMMMGIVQLGEGKEKKRDF